MISHICSLREGCCMTKPEDCYVRVSAIECPHCKAKCPSVNCGSVYLCSTCGAGLTLYGLPLEGILCRPSVLFTTPGLTATSTNTNHTLGSIMLPRWCLYLISVVLCLLGLGLVYVGLKL